MPHRLTLGRTTTLGLEALGELAALGDAAALGELVRSFEMERPRGTRSAAGATPVCGPLLASALTDIVFCFFAGLDSDPSLGPSLSGTSSCWDAAPLGWRLL